MKTFHIRRNSQKNSGRHIKPDRRKMQNIRINYVSRRTENAGGKIGKNFYRSVMSQAEKQVGQRKKHAQASARRKTRRKYVKLIQGYEHLLFSHRSTRTSNAVKREKAEGIT